MLCIPNGRLFPEAVSTNANTLSATSTGSWMHGFKAIPAPDCQGGLCSHTDAVLGIKSGYLHRKRKRTAGRRLTGSLLWETQVRLLIGRLARGDLRGAAVSVPRWPGLHTILRLPCLVCICWHKAAIGGLASLLSGAFQLARSS